MKYIIYSGAKGQYSLREKSENFPSEFESSIRRLYEQNILVEKPGKSGTTIRFSPLNGENYLLSVMYCSTSKVGEAVDSRPGYTGVNFICSAEEMDEAFGIGCKNMVQRYIDCANKKLREHDYVYPDAPRTLHRAEENLELKQKRLEAFFAALGASVEEMGKGEPKFPCQVYIGYDAEAECPEVVLEEMMDAVPLKMRKIVSFYLGPELPREFHGVSMVLVDNEILNKMWRGNDFSGAPMTHRIILLREDFVKNDYTSVWKEFAKEKYGKKREKLNEILKEYSWKEYCLAVKIVLNQKKFSPSDVGFLSDPVFACLVEGELLPFGYMQDAAKELDDLAEYPQTVAELEIYRPHEEEKKEKTKSRKKDKSEAKKKKADDEGKEAEKRRKKAFLSHQDERDVSQSEADIPQTVREKKEESDGKREPKHKKKTVTRKFLLLLGVLLCALIPLALFIGLAFMGIRTVESPNMMTVRLDANVLFYLLSLLITTIVNIPLGYLLISMVKELSKEMDSEE